MFILVFILTILVLVVIHELGHFLVAKKFGIKVLEFGFGLPPRIWGKQVGETLVSLNWIPYGGFVRLLGEDEADPKILENERSFAYQNVWKRIAVVVAGISMNLLLAFVLYYVVLAAQGFAPKVPLLTNHHFVGVTQQNEEIILVGEVAKDSPAQKAGIKAEDRIVALNNQPLDNAEQLIALTKKEAGQSVTLTLTDFQKQDPHQVTLTPRVNPPAGQGAMGISLGTYDQATLYYNTWWEKLLSGPIHSYNLTVYSLEVFGQTISAAFAQHNFAPISENVAGPVAITTIVKQILQINNPLIPLLDFVAALSLNLALVNVLPFPGLDGGRLFFLLIEAIFRRKVPARIEGYVHTVGFIILIGLVFLITASDIHKLF